MQSIKPCATGLLPKTVRAILNAGPVGEQLSATGWVKSIRKQRNMTFIELNDGTMSDSLQIVSRTDHLPAINLIPGSGLRATGILVKSLGKGQALELQAHQLEIVGPCDVDYPVQKKDHSAEFLRTVPHLRNRAGLHAAVTRVRSKAANAFRSTLLDQDFLEVHAPVITFSDCEGAGETFQIAGSEQFFGSTAHLTVSSQLHGEIASNASSRIYTFGPTFRAEKHNTTRHLSEFWMLEPEISFIDSLEQLMFSIEDLIISSTNSLLNSAKEDLELVGRLQENSPELEQRWEMITKPYSRLSYTDAVAELTKFNSNFSSPLKWGDSLQLEHEKFLVDTVVKGPVFVADYPAGIKAFYMKMNPDNRTVACCDLLVPGLAELVGGSLREEKADRLRRRMTDLGMQVDMYSWYLDLRRYGGVPHGGFGLGFERFLQYITGVQNIRDIVDRPFVLLKPRAPGSVLLSRWMEVEEIFLAFCRAEPEGVSEKDFRAKHPEWSTEAVVVAINKLTADGLIELMKRGNQLVCKAVAADFLELASGLEGDEKIVYQCIKAADNKGIWTKDLKLRTNLHQTVITKVLKSLESRKIIKAVKSVKNSTRKVYMLASLEPSQEITGGPWFSENELDTEFIEELCKVCLRYIATKSEPSKAGHIYGPGYTGYPSLEQIHRFLRDSKVTSADLGSDDVGMLLDRLIFDGLVERVIYAGPRESRIVDDDEDDEIYVYRSVHSALPESLLASVPCGQCPVFDKCADFGPITPATCSYYTEWLSF